MDFSMFFHSYRLCSLLSCSWKTCHGGKLDEPHSFRHHLTEPTSQWCESLRECKHREGGVLFYSLFPWLQWLITGDIRATATDNILLLIKSYLTQSAVSAPLKMWQWECECEAISLTWAGLGWPCFCHRNFLQTTIILHRYSSNYWVLYD